MECGLTANFLHEFNNCYKKLKNKKIKNKTISIACGELIFETIENLTKKIEYKIKGLKINVYPVTNYFFGKSVTVTGLVTGSDLIKNLSKKELGEGLYIPKVMLKEEQKIFLDDLKLEEVEAKLKTKIIEVNDLCELIKQITI